MSNSIDNSGNNSGNNRNDMIENRIGKLNQLIDQEGFSDAKEAVEIWVNTGEVDGICVNLNCDYTTLVEPDCTNGYCEMCITDTVVSGLELYGI